MTPEGLVPLRLAATAVHTLPGLRLRLRDGDRALVDVARAEAPGIVTPCAFRRAVVEAHRRFGLGQRLRFLGLEEGEVPTIDVGARAPDGVLAGGIYRVFAGGAQLHAFATTVAPSRCRVLAAERGIARTDLVLQRDTGTDVTLVHTTDPPDEVLAEPPEPLVAMLAACFAEHAATALALQT